MPQPEEPQRLLESQIATLGEQKAQLESALARLNGSAAGGRSSRLGQGGGRGRRTTNGGTAGTGRTATRGARVGDVVADLKAHPDSTAGEMAHRMGINPDHARTIVRDLVRQDVATKEGQRYSVAAEWA